MSIPDNISRENIEKALDEIDHVGIRPNRKSSTYDLVARGRRYPPKLVLSISNRFANEQELDHTTFSGGEDSPAFSYLRGLGYFIEPKTNRSEDVRKELVKTYKAMIGMNANQDELYKWELIKEFQEIWADDSKTSTEKLSTFNFKNLTDYRSEVFVKEAQNYPSKFEEWIKELYTSAGEDNWYNEIHTKAKFIYDDLNAEWAFRLDERTIATLLTLRYPNRFTFYMASFYKDYCNLIGEKTKSPGQRYDHYLELLQEFIKEVILKDEELIELSQQTLSEVHYTDPNFLLLAQDILFQTVRSSKDPIMKEQSSLSELLQEIGFELSSMFFDVMDDLVTGLALSPGDERISISGYQKQLNFIIGQRYAWAVNGASELVFRFMSSTSLDDVEKSTNFTRPENAFLHDTQNFTIVENHIGDSISLSNEELARTNLSGFRKHHRQDLENAVFDKEFRNEIFNQTFGRNPLKRQRFYWVCQGNNYEEEKNSGIIWAPTHKNQHHHDRLKDVRTNDVIIHYANGAIRAFSSVLKEAVISRRPYKTEDREDEGYLVETQFQELETPIPISSVNKVLNSGGPMLPEKYSPISSAGTVNQGYLFNFTKAGFIALTNLNADKSYWIFQSNPKIFNNTLALKRGVLFEFNVRAHKDKIRIGDKALQWIGGEQSGFYATLIISSGPFKGFEGHNSVCVQTEYNFVENPVSKTVVSDDPILSKSNVGLQGTNFKSSDEEYNQLLKLAKIGIKPMNPIAMKLNTIYYGPPGTGKTYKLRNEIAKRFTETDRVKTREDYIRQEVKNMTWWEVVAIALIDMGVSKVSAIQNHIAVKEKIAQSNNRTVNNTIWGSLQEHSEDTGEFKYRGQHPVIFEKGANSEWSMIDGSDELVPNLYKVVHSDKEYSETKEEVINYTFTTFHQSFSYEDFIEGIKPIMGEEADGEIGYEIEPGIFFQACNKACQLAGYEGGLQDCLSDNLEGRKQKFSNAEPYAIFIDEINRGNIASIFGELITLIEDDKRLTGDQELVVTLPYSKQPFGVPPNLFLVGTMNTADRSVEALDSALRRRFIFEEIGPDSNTITTHGRSKDTSGIIQINGRAISLPMLLDLINQRIEVLLDKDHLIGHSYFIEVSDWISLKDAFENKIIPLLEEYFYGDRGKIALVLGDGFIELRNQENADSIFPETDYDGADILETRQVWSIKKDWTKDEGVFKVALNRMGIK